MIYIFVEGLSKLGMLISINVVCISIVRISKEIYEVVIPAMQKLVLSINYMSISPHVSFSLQFTERKKWFSLWSCISSSWFHVDQTSWFLSKTKRVNFNKKKCLINLLLLLLFVRFLHMCKVHRNLTNNSSNKMCHNPSIIWPKVIFIKTQIWNITSREYCYMC